MDTPAPDDPIFVRSMALSHGIRFSIGSQPEVRKDWAENVQEFAVSVNSDVHTRAGNNPYRGVYHWSAAAHVDYLVSMGYLHIRIIA